MSKLKEKFQRFDIIIIYIVYLIILWITTDSKCSELVPPHTINTTDPRTSSMTDTYNIIQNSLFQSNTELKTPQSDWYYYCVPINYKTYIKL